MNKQAFISLLKNPEKISSSDIEGLEEVLSNFPYFQAAQLLAAKGYKDHGKMLAGQKLKKAALYSAERKELKKLITPAKEKASDPIKANKPVVEKSIYSIPSIPSNEVSLPIEKKKEEPIIIQKAIVESNEVLKKEEIIPTPTSIAKEKEEAVAPKKENTEGDNNSIKERFATKYISDSVRNQFFEELQRNLQSLREMKKRTADELSSNKNEVNAIEEAPAPQSILQPREITSPEKLIEQLYEIPASSNRSPIEEEIKLIPEKVKEHNQDEELFTSRLDGVIFSSEKPDRAKSIDESDLLLGYLSYLESSKKQAIPKKKVVDIIDKFIKTDPSISPLDKSKLNEEFEDKSVNSIKPANKIVSENMAKIFLIQGKNDKAIEIYEQLLLKYPEKKAYFETQIENIKSK